MTINYRFVPLVWTGPSTPADRRRDRRTFRAAWSATMTDLARQLGHLAATDIVLGGDFRESDIRLDGMLRSDARAPGHPGIQVSFRSRHGYLSYRTDTCAWWQHNVRSIALGLEALRAVDRYGITAAGQQYAGFRAIEAGEPSHMTAGAALTLLSRIARTRGASLTGPRLFKVARAAAHPDLHNGDRTQWDQVEQAGRVLGLLDRATTKEQS